MYIRQLVEAIMSTRKDLYVLISIDDNNEYWTMDVLTEAYTIDGVLTMIDDSNFKSLIMIYNPFDQYCSVISDWLKVHLSVECRMREKQLIAYIVCSDPEINTIEIENMKLEDSLLAERTSFEYGGQQRIRTQSIE